MGINTAINYNPPMNDEYWMGQALEQATRASAVNEVPIGAVIVLEDKCISTAHNQSIKNSDPCAHAEIQALRAAGQFLGNYRLNDCTLYVTLEPCLMCVGAMVHARIQRCIFGASDPKTGACTSRDKLFEHPMHNHHVELTVGVMAAECSAILKAFFKNKR